MNKSLIEINDNYGISIDDKGDTTIINKTNNNTSFKEILQKENTLESLNNKLNDANNQYDNTKIDLIFGKTLNVFTVLGTLILAKVVPYPSLLTVCGMFFTLSEVTTILFYRLPIFALPILKRRKLKKLQNKISELKIEIYKLERELSDIKEKTNYIISENTLENNCQEVSFTNMAQSENKNLGKVRVLRLTK